MLLKTAKITAAKLARAGTPAAMVAATEPAIVTAKERLFALPNSSGHEPI